MTQLMIVSCKCVSVFTLKCPTVDGDTLNGTIEDQHLRKVAWNTSYSCPLNKSVDLMSVDNQRAKIRIPFIQVQAFSFPMSGNFSTGNMTQRCALNGILV